MCQLQPDYNGVAPLVTGCFVFLLNSKKERREEENENLAIVQGCDLSRLCWWSNPITTRRRTMRGIQKKTAAATAVLSPLSGAHYPVPVSYQMQGWLSSALGRNQCFFSSFSPVFTQILRSQSLSLLFTLIRLFISSRSKTIVLFSSIISPPAPPPVDVWLSPPSRGVVCLPGE